MKDFAEKSTTLTTTGTTKDAAGSTIANVTTFTKKCTLYAIEESVLDCTFNNEDGTTVYVTGITVDPFVPLYNVSKITLTSGTVTCAV